MRMKISIFVVLAVVLCSLLFLLPGASVMATHLQVVAELDKTILRSPGVDAIVYGGRPTLKWYPVTDATVYDVELYGLTDNLIGDWTKGVGACDPGPYCEYRIPFDLQSNYGDYDWRIQARNTDTGASGAWSDLRTFTYTQLDRTVQISPEDGYTSNDDSPTLQWTDVIGATMYLVQFRLPDDTLVFNTLVSDATGCDGSTCTWDVDPALAEGEYKWHVRAKNGRNFGRWTAYRTITYDDGVTTFDFNGSAPNWIDPGNKWDIQNNATYTGTYGSCTTIAFTSGPTEYLCPWTAYDEGYTDASFETRLRSTGTNAGEGYSIYIRSTFNSSGVWINGYQMSFYQSGSDIIQRLFRAVGGSYSYYNPITIPNKNITDYHTLKFDVYGTRFDMYFDDVYISYLPTMSASVTEGLFAVDVRAITKSSHLVDMDWAEITIFFTPPTPPSQDINMTVPAIEPIEFQIMEADTPD